MDVLGTYTYLIALSVATRPVTLCVVACSPWEVVDGTVAVGRRRARVEGATGRVSLSELHLALSSAVDGAAAVPAGATTSPSCPCSSALSESLLPRSPSLPPWRWSTRSGSSGGQPPDALERPSVSIGRGLSGKLCRSTGEEWRGGGRPILARNMYLYRVDLGPGFV